MTPQRLIAATVAGLALTMSAGCGSDSPVQISINDPADQAAERLGDHATDMLEEVNIDVSGALICDMNFEDGDVSGSCEGLDVGAKDIEVTLTGTGSIDDGTCEATITAVRDGEVEAEESGFDCLEGIDTSDE